MTHVSLEPTECLAASLIEAAKNALPGLPWQSLSTDDFSICAVVKFVGTVYCHRLGGDRVAVSFAGQPVECDSAEEAFAWIRTNITARRDALDATLGEGWVKVSERLPEPRRAADNYSSDVLVVSVSGDYAVVSYDHWFKEWSDGEGYTHWRGLPATPKADL